MTVALLLCLLVLLGLGLAERVARDRAWRAIPIRVHVNGSRGKSTVTRLVWSALREAGVPAVAKTTGTAPRLLLPDGTERPIRRRAPAAVREQLVALRAARRLGARAIVIECMALDPELQWISEREMVKATIGVITNVRLDHTEIMGSSLASIAATLANTIPRSARLVVGDTRFLALFEARASRLGTEVITARAGAPGPDGIRLPANGGGRQATGDAPPWLREDMAVALAVTRQSGIEDEVALRGFAAAPPDPGAAREGVLEVEGRRIAWLDATAANDPDSLGALDRAPDDERSAQSGVARTPTVAIYNHRADRGTRLTCFARHSATILSASRLLVTGERPPMTVWRELRRSRRADTRFVPRRRLATVLRQQTGAARVVFCGNTRGLDIQQLLRETRGDG